MGAICVQTQTHTWVLNIHNKVYYQEIWPHKKIQFKIVFHEFKYSTLKNRIWLFKLEEKSWLQKRSWTGLQVVFGRFANGGVPQGPITSPLHFADLKNMAMVCRLWASCVPQNPQATGVFFQFLLTTKVRVFAVHTTPTTQHTYSMCAQLCGSKVVRNACATLLLWICWHLIGQKRELK